MRLRLTEILDFYDAPQLFVALDTIGTSYLCLAYDNDDLGRSLCVAVNISKERLNDFITGHIDLRQIYIEPELSLFDVIEDGEIIEAVPRTEAPTEDMLPDEGYYSDFAKRENHDMVQASLEERKTIIRLAFNYETNNHTIPAKLLTEALHNFQSMLTTAYIKVARVRDVTPARLYARAAIAASFDIELVANEETDIFGGSKVSSTLDLLSPLFGDEDEAVANCLATFKSTQRSYKNFLKTLTEQDVSFKFKWVQESMTSIVNEIPVDKERIRSLYSLASSLQILEEKEVEFEGCFFMANVRNGRWGFALIGNDKRKYGVCLENGRLDGIVLKDVLYKITCIEKPSQNPNTGEEYKAYVLISIKRQD